MAMSHATSSSAMFSSSHNRSPVLFGFSTMATNHNFGKTSKNFQIRCQEQQIQQRNLAPVEQRWMFTDSDFTGPDVWNKTWYPKAEDHVNTEKTWYVVDASDKIDKILGRLASTIAIHIRGKNLATYTPSVDTGAFVIVVNAEKVVVSGKKRTQKLYRRHSGRPGGMKVETFDHFNKEFPKGLSSTRYVGCFLREGLEEICLPTLSLKVYTGPDHPHQAQKPIDLPIRERDKRIQKQT